MRPKNKSCVTGAAFEYVKPIASFAFRGLESTLALHIGFVRDGAQLSTQHVQSVKRNRPDTQILPKLKASLCMIALGLGVSGVFNNAWAVVCTDVTITGDVGAQTNAGTVCDFSIASDDSIQGLSDGINNSGTINTLINSGQIDGFHGYGIINVGTITTLTNSGRINGNAYAINNVGTITTLNNTQGQGSTGAALTFRHTLPTKYNIIIVGSTNYGQLSIGSPNGTMVFGISSLSTTSSAIVGQTLTGVL